MNYYLVQLKPARPGFPDDATPRELNLVAEHFDYYQKLVDVGTAVIVGRTDEKTPTGIALLKTTSTLNAEKIFREDPAIVAKIMVGHVSPFRLALCNIKSLV